MITHGGGSLIDRVGGGVIPELTSDPASPNAQQAWVLKTGGSVGSGGGLPYGLLLALTYPGVGGGAPTYQFSYRTIENTTIRVSMS